MISKSSSYSYCVRISISTWLMKKTTQKKIIRENIRMKINPEDWKSRSTLAGNPSGVAVFLLTFFFSRFFQMLWECQHKKIFLLLSLARRPRRRRRRRRQSASVGVLSIKKQERCKRLVFSCWLPFLDSQTVRQRDRQSVRQRNTSILWLEST